MIRLASLHLIGNAVLLALGYWWLSVGESSGANLALSIALLLVFVSGAAWLHGASLAYFREPGQGIRPVLGAVSRRLLPLVLVAVFTVAVYFALEAWSPLNESRATDVASYFTLTLQRPVRPAAVQRVFNALWWIVQWMIVPVLLIPLASGVATRGWAGLGEIGSRNWRYWLLTPVLLAAAVWAPLQLVTWKPLKGAFGMEMASAVARFGVAYLLFVAACLALAFVTSRGKPSFNQPTTAVSP